MGRMFGTDGVRGVANVDPISVEMVVDLGRAAACVCKERAKSERQRIAIGKDTRQSGSMLEAALTAGICSAGVDVMLLGVLPTPGIAFLVRDLGADAGMVISASHNPFQDNGIKIFSGDGYKLPDAAEDEIEELITSGEVREIAPTAEGIGKAGHVEHAVGRYVEFCKGTFPQDLSIEGLKVVLDCGNGATYKVAPAVFAELGAEVAAIHDQPNGTNINERCGSQHTEDLRANVVESGADVGLAFDGDGDRLIAVDEKGEEITGDHILAICGKMYKERGWLKQDMVVSTVMSNFGLGIALKGLGIEQGVSKVGDRYVLEMMKEKGAVVGGEESGHMIFLNHHTTGDGIISALQLLAAMQMASQPLSELSKVMTLSPQKLVNVEVQSKPPLEELTDVQAAVKAAEAELGDKGRVLIRYSGTQQKCRVMVEGPTEEMTDRLCGELAGAVKKAIG